MKKILLVLFLFTLSSCSIFQSSEKEDKNAKNDAEEVYVFDEVSETKEKSKEIDDLKKEVDNSLSKNENASTNTQKKNEKNYSNDQMNMGNSFFLQLGAFTSLKRAEQFINENNSKVPFVMSIVFNNEKALYTVRSSAYSTKAEAQMIRDGFWKQNMFKDAFIVTQ